MEKPFYSKWWFSFMLAFIIVFSADYLLNFSGLWSNTDVVDEVQVSFNSPNWPNSPVGNGSFDIANQSGNTSDGDSIVIYYDDNLAWHDVSFSASDLDGRLLTFFFIDDIEVDKLQIGLGHQSTLFIPEEITNGTHVVRAVQFEQNDKTKDIVFYREHEFEMKND